MQPRVKLTDSVEANILQTYRNIAGLATFPIFWDWFGYLPLICFSRNMEFGALIVLQVYFNVLHYSRRCSTNTTAKPVAPWRVLRFADYVLFIAREVKKVTWNYFTQNRFIYNARNVYSLCMSCKHIYYSTQSLSTCTALRQLETSEGMSCPKQVVSWSRSHFFTAWMARSSSSKLFLRRAFLNGLVRWNHETAG